MRAHRPIHSDLDPVAKFKANARAYANVYQRRGKLIPQPCERCGVEHAQKHHEDYTKPLEVRWLCRPCHLAEHAPSKILAADGITDRCKSESATVL